MLGLVLLLALGIALGGIFWRNKGFVEHARETGLANMPQLGVIPDTH